MRSLKSQLLVIGAGLGGMTAALALLRYGVPVAVYETAPELGDVGAGITMWPNATRVLEHLGLFEEMRSIAVVPTDMGNRHYLTGEFLTHTMVGDAIREKVGAPHYFIHRADLHGILVDAIRAIDPEAIHLDKTLVGLSQDDDGVDAHFADGTTARGSALIGCDGLRSATRAALLGSDEPRFTGVVAWRGLVPLDRLTPDLMTPTSCTWNGPGHHFVRYPVRDRTLMNYVAFGTSDGWAEEGWRIHSEVSEVLDEFAGWDERVIDVIRATPPELCFKWALFDRDPLDQWTVGRVTLLGDAAHPALPFLGQGAGMAIEDGLILARAFAASETIPDALSRYETARKPRAHFVQLEARRAQDAQMVAPPEVDPNSANVRKNTVQEDLRAFDAVSAPV